MIHFWFDKIINLIIWLSQIIEQYLSGPIWNYFINILRTIGQWFGNGISWIIQIVTLYVR
ncbi:MAG: hypothetical protein NTW73_00885 [Candidatus Parcubacteria bacterium]|nr:hypothetical protein [Candidatus Parcubacteria bacterium]